MKTVDISWRRYVLPNINKEGWKFFGIFAAITALLAMIWEPLGVIGLVCTVWCYYFSAIRNGLRRKLRTSWFLPPTASYK